MLPKYFKKVDKNSHLYKVTPLTGVDPHMSFCLKIDMFFVFLRTQDNIDPFDKAFPITLRTTHSVKNTYITYAFIERF